MKPLLPFSVIPVAEMVCYFSLQLGSEVQTEFFLSSVLLLQERVHCTAGEVADVQTERSLGVWVRGVDQGPVAGLPPIKKQLWILSQIKTCQRSQWRL